MSSNMPDNKNTGKEIKNNLFIITSVGQLRNISGFIDQYNAKSNVLTVLYTEENMTVVKNIKKHVDKAIFLNVQFIKMPKKWVTGTKTKSITIHKILSEVLSSNIQQYGVKNLFICLGIGHYSFFEELSKGKVSLNLIEEGLATYRIYLEDNNERDKKVSSKQVSKSFKNMGKKLYVFFQALIKFLLTTLSFICRINLLYYARRGAMKHSKYKYGLIYKFDNTYLCYPQLMKDLNKNIGDVHELKFNYTDENIKFVSEQDRRMGGVLFINQKYGIRYKEHFPIVFSILSDMNIKKVYMKFHPKENPDSFKTIFDQCREWYPEVEVITVDGTAQIPVENLLNYNNITKLIGITSSSLFYSKLVKEDIEIVSIATEYKKRCKEVGVIKQRMETFNKDYKAFLKLSDVEQYVCEKEGHTPIRRFPDQNAEIKL